jgi:hypothetical protein
VKGSIGRIVGVGLVLLLGCARDDGAADPEATTAATSSGPAEASPSVEPEELLPIISGPCCAGLPLDEGRHETPPWFGAPFTIDVGRRLSGVGAEPERILEIGRGTSSSGNLDHYVAFFAVDDAAKVLRAFRSTPRADVGPTEPLAVEDLEGSQVGASAEPAPADPADEEIAGGAIRIGALDRLTPAFFYTESPRARMLLLAIERGSTDLIVYIESPPRDFEEFAREVDEMLASIEFLEP